MASEYAQHLIVFWVSAEIFDPDVPVSDSDVDFIFLAMNLCEGQCTPLMSSSSI